MILFRSVHWLQISNLVLGVLILQQAVSALRRMLPPRAEHRAVSPA